MNSAANFILFFFFHQILCHPIDVGNANGIVPPPIGNESIVNQSQSMPTSTPQQIQLMEGKDDELVFVHSVKANMKLIEFLRVIADLETR
jgi:hypothetical protein